MRVLHVIPSLAAAHGGPSRAMALIEQALAAEGVHVETATTDDDGHGGHNGKALARPLSENGVTRWYFARNTLAYKTSAGLGAWLMRNAGRFDLVHVHALFSFSSTLACWAARSRGVPYVLRPLGTLASYGMSRRRPWLKRASVALLEGAALRRAAAVHFTSEQERQEAGALGVPMRGVVLPLGLELPQPAPAALVRERFAALGAAPYVLFLGRLDPVKNVEGLLRAFALLAARRPGLRLLVAGDGPADFSAHLQAVCRELAVDPQVVWAGRVEGELKSSALAGAELCVLPSFSESFGIAAAEALFAGLPCVLGEGVAIAEEVVQAGAGLAVPPLPQPIASAIERILADPGLRADMSRKGRALAQQRYSATAMGRQLKQLYAGILHPVEPSP
jgi:glycosyltransferase involved in cell wall biosynthesis